MILLGCDVCWFGGPGISSDSFRSVGDVILCEGCADADMVGPVGAGGHTVGFVPGGEGWEFSCGRVYEAPVFLLPPVVEAIPNLVAVMARLHVQAYAELSTVGGR